MGKLVLDSPGTSKKSYIGRALSTFGGRNDNPTQPGEVVFGYSDVFSQFKPNWDFKPQYSPHHQEYVNEKETTNVPVTLSGKVDLFDFQDSVALFEFLDEAKARGYLVDTWEQTIAPLSMHRLSDLEYEKVDPKSDLNLNPNQGRLGGIPNAVETRGDNLATYAHKTQLQKMYERGEYTTDFDEALSTALGTIPKQDLVYRGARPEGYSTGRELVSIEQQAQIPGAVGGKQGERLYSVSVGDPEYPSAYMMNRPLGTMYAGYTQDIEHYYPDADSQMVDTARTVLAHDIEKLTPIMHSAFIENDDGTVAPIYFPIKNNKLVDRLMDANKKYDEYEQLSLFD